MTSHELLQRRIDIGRAAIAKAGDPGEDLETAASDTIADILTAVCGPYGRFTQDGALRPTAGAVERAHALIDRAMSSWAGDAEDYDADA